MLICAVSLCWGRLWILAIFELQSGDKICHNLLPKQLNSFPAPGSFPEPGVLGDDWGASKICYYLASQLLEMGMSVRIIDQNEQRCVQMSERLPKALVIVETVRTASCFTRRSGADRRVCGHHRHGRG